MNLLKRGYRISQNARIFAIVFALAFFVLLVILPLSIYKKRKVKDKDLPLSFINFSENRITGTSSSKSLERIGELLAKARGKGEPVRILHIGDSHIQADFFTAETRRLLSQWISNQNTSRGFTFPYSMVKSNNPDDYDVSWEGEWTRNRWSPNDSSLLGLAGISASTTDTLSRFGISIKESTIGFSPFNMVRVHYKANGFEPILLEPINAELLSSDQNHMLYSLETLSFSVKFGLENAGQSNGSFTLFGVELLNSDAILQYHAAGVNGATVGTFLGSSNFIQQAKGINPYLIIVSLGTNDVYLPSYNSAKFSRDFSELIGRITSALPMTAVVVTTPGDHLINGQQINPNIADINKVIYKVANEKGCAIWDFYKIMGGEGSVNLWANQGFCATDKLHLNRKGYRLQGSLLFEAMIIAANDYCARADSNQ
ncbi:MAG: GDSL-type esterase/lipase family protein [Bacteroidales bacterium]|jgi:lysophospholipase L1-like esterase|nr:GDSL-type esterase/lipase family protein [Bacteroidales bacterium]MDD4384760.1 GDSL-type esterase/lipase family protein [Bacteroidales bacterium]MDY0198056.1 GDSL-type esterase/lipase family protein [Tenuifilaceae bacterium]